MKQLSVDAKSKELALLQTESEQPNFWDDQQHAQATMKNIEITASSRTMARAAPKLLTHVSLPGYTIVRLRLNWMRRLLRSKNNTKH